MKIIIACEHHMIRESIRMLLNSAGTDKEIHEAMNEQQLVEKLSLQSLDILICDSELPSLDIQSLIAQIIEQNPQMKVLIFTDSIKINQLKHRFNSVPIMCIDQPDSGDQILNLLDNLSSLQPRVTPDTKDALVNNHRGS